MEPTPAIAGNPFAPSEFERRKNRGVARKKWIMFGFCLALVVPLLVILADIFYKASPVLSLDYLWQNPAKSVRLR